LEVWRRRGFPAFNGGQQMMIESMQKEIDKSFLKGIAASPGIVIGKAYVFHDILLPERHMILPHPKR
jgi:hypothetical protein